MGTLYTSAKERGYYLLKRRTKGTTMNKLTQTEQLEVAVWLLKNLDENDRSFMSLDAPVRVWLLATKRFLTYPFHRYESAWIVNFSAPHIKKDNLLSSLRPRKRETRMQILIPLLKKLMKQDAVKIEELRPLESFGLPTTIENEEIITMVTDWLFPCNEPVDMKSLSHFSKSVPSAPTANNLNISQQLLDATFKELQTIVETKIRLTNPHDTSRIYKLNDINSFLTSLLSTQPYDRKVYLQQAIEGLQNVCFENSRGSQDIDLNHRTLRALEQARSEMLDGISPCSSESTS